MEVLEILGYVFASLIGLSLGLTGAGGAILTVPIMVYLMGIDPITSTAYSLFVVGSTASVGAIRNYRKGLSDVRVALLFGIPSFIVIYLVRRYLIEIIPEELFSVGTYVFTKNTMVLILFAALMLVSASRMIRSKRKELAGKEEKPSNKLILLLIQGAFVGFISGLVGAGGGFLIVPALVLLAGLPMKKAIGTSLLIIACNALIGFTGDLAERAIDWAFLLPFSAIAVAGIFLGMRWADKVNGAKLKKGFGYFILVIAILMILSETLL